MPISFSYLALVIMKDIQALSQFSGLGTRTQFNRALRHLVNVTGIIDSVVAKGVNLTELLFDLVQQETIERNQVLPIVSVILREKLQATCECRNLTHDFGEDDFAKVVKTCAGWTAINLECIYYHPQLGVAPFNPSRQEHWDAMQNLKQNELLVVYARSKNDKPESVRQAINDFFALLAGQNIKENPDYKLPQQAVATPVPAPTPAPAATAAVASPTKPPAKPKGKMNLTPKYSVQVTNELFHNGNVEAWKNIIESYHLKHKENRVIVYHEGELIQDLNSLFKWGKVKHGGLLLFQVAGQQIKNVSRLQKYLFEGASQRYEAFMKHDVNKALQLF